MSGRPSDNRLFRCYRSEGKIGEFTCMQRHDSPRKDRIVWLLGLLTCRSLKKDINAVLIDHEFMFFTEGAPAQVANR